MFNFIRIYYIFDVSDSGTDVTVINYYGGDVTDATNGTPGPGFSFSITDGVEPGDMDWVIKKFSSSGTELWSKEFDSGSGNNEEGYGGQHLTREKFLHICSNTIFTVISIQ